MKIDTLYTWLKRSNKELFVWPLALLSLALMDPEVAHWSLCPLKNLGWDFCPGCGLGQSIAFLFHGDWLRSWKSHPLGVFALAILLYRTATLALSSYHSLTQIKNNAS